MRKEKAVLKESYDVVVLGGGPAGSTAAGFLARAGLKVALFEKEKFPRYHIGESLLPATTLGVLAKLGLKDKLEAAGFPVKRGGTFRWGKSPEPWTFRFYRTDGERLADGSEPEHLTSYQVRRAEFDAMLLDHARALGADVFEESSAVAVEGIDAAAKTVLIDLPGGASAAATAPFVIDASGRGSVARKLFGERHFDPFFRNVAVFGYFEGGRRLPGDRSGNIFCEAFPEGWFWYIPLSETLTSVGVVLGREKYDALRSTKPEALLKSMIAKTGHVRELLKPAVPCKKAPYDRVRVEADFSYAHSRFWFNGVFLAGDAACFIDPVFSSGVHLATYSGYLASQAILRIRSGRQALDEACAEYERLYRREYTAFYRFLLSFYEMHRDESSYFWKARKALGRRQGSDLDAFISIVSGASTTGGLLFDSPEKLREAVHAGRRSLETLRDKVSGVAVGDAELARAREFMKPLHESRRDLLAGRKD